MRALQHFSVQFAGLLILTTMGFNATAQEFQGYTLRVKLLGDSLSDALYSAVIPAWEKSTGAKVQIVSKKEHSHLDREIRQDIAQRTVDYCLASSHTSFTPAYGDEFRDLRQLLPLSHLAHFDQHVLQLSKIDNVLVQLPRYSDISQVFYNKALYSDPDNRSAYRVRFGKELEPPTTWDEFSVQARFFTQAPNLYGTQFAGKREALTGRFYEMLVANGGQLFDKNWHPTFNSPAGLHALNFFVDLYQAGAVSKNFPKNSWKDLAHDFASGSVALDLEWGGWASHFNDPNTSRLAGHVGVLRAPKGTSGRRTGWSGLHTFSITKNCDNPGAAASLLMALTSLDAQLVEARQGKLVARTDAATKALAEFRHKGNSYMANVLSVFSSAMAEDAFTPPLLPEWPAVSDAIWPELQHAILGQISPRQALKQAEKNVTIVMRDAGRLR